MLLKPIYSAGLHFRASEALEMRMMCLIEGIA